MRGCAQILIEHEARLTLHRGTKFPNRSRGERLAIKMCAHTFVFHAPEGRASYTVGVLHVPKARFACGAKRRLRRTVPRETVFSTEKRLWKNVFEKKTKKACIPE